MPLKLVRLIAVVVALVVPLQGMAALAASQCMAFGHHDAAAMSHDAQGAHEDHAAHDDSHASSDEADGKHCGPCAACCASVTISGPVPLSIEPDAFSAPYVVVAQPLVRPAPDELDRPPLAL